MPKLKPEHVYVTQAEDVAITAAAMADPDAGWLSDTEWNAAKPLVRLGRPKAEMTKERISIRLSRDVLSQFRATGQGWQTRMDTALRQFISQYPPTGR